MSDVPLTRDCDRALTSVEQELLLALLCGAGDLANNFVPQVPDVRVVAESASTWPILDFAVVGERGSAGFVVAAEAYWSEGSGLLGVHVLASGGTLACMECWAVDGLATPASWPVVQQLRRAP